MIAHMNQQQNTLAPNITCKNLRTPHHHHRKSRDTPHKEPEHQSSTRITSTRTLASPLSRTRTIVAHAASMTARKRRTSLRAARTPRTWRRTPSCARMPRRSVRDAALCVAPRARRADTMRARRLLTLDDINPRLRGARRRRRRRDGATARRTVDDFHVTIHTRARVDF